MKPGDFVLQNPGRLKLQGNNIVFRTAKTAISDQFQGTDVESVKWLKRARGYCLKMQLHSGHIYRFDGFKEGVCYPLILKQTNIRTCCKLGCPIS